MPQSAKQEPNWAGVYKLGGVAVLVTVLVGILESTIQFLPVSNIPLDTVLDWFVLFQEHPFMGLRNMGLLNIFLNTLALFTYFALYVAHRENSNQPYAALAMVIAFLGIGVFLATNRAFPMLDLSNQYAAATTDRQQAMLEAAGKSMLTVGQSHTPGTFLGFFLSEVAGIIISVVMLRSNIFSKINAYAGILGFSVLLVIEFFSTFFGLSNAMIMLFMFGGFLSTIWYILIARRLFQLAQSTLVE